MFQDPQVKCVGSSVFCLGLISSALSSVTKQNPEKFSYKEVGRRRGVATFLYSTFLGYHKRQPSLHWAEPERAFQMDP